MGTARAALPVIIHVYNACFALQDTIGPIAVINWFQRLLANYWGSGSDDISALKSISLLRDATGKFPDFPDADAGGSAAIFKKREEPVSFIVSMQMVPLLYL